MVTRPAFIESRGPRFMPYFLKDILFQHGITQPQWCQAIKQAGGMPLSPSAANQILNWGIWPRATAALNIKNQTEDFLRSQGIDESIIAKCWVENDTPTVIAGRRPTKNAEATKTIIEIDTLGEPEMLSPNAKKQFSIFRDPFKDEVNCADDVYTSPDIRYIREAMFTTAKHGGLLAVVGESGGGKSVLRRDLIERINRDREQIIVIFPRVIDKTKLSAGSICEAIIKDFQPEASLPLSLESKARAVEKMLKASADSGNKHVIIIEEAHDITIQCMKYLKRFWELEDGFKKLLSIVLIGQPELMHKLNEGTNPEAREFIRRCEVAHLVPLDRHLEEYLQFKFKRVGIELNNIFEQDTYDAIRKRLTKEQNGRLISYLNPLLVNNLVTKALNLAAEIGEDKVSADVIKRL